jgi:prefoldin subunit 5
LNLTSELKKRIKELESKLRGCDQVIADFKKSSSRAQEINRDLMEKVKSRDVQLEKRDLDVADVKQQISQLKADNQKQKLIQYDAQQYQAL